MPNYGEPRVPNYGAPQAPNYGAPQAPNYGAPQPPNFGAPQAPNYGAPQAPNYGAPQPPNFGAPPAPTWGAPPPAPRPAANPFDPNAEEAGDDENSYGMQNAAPGEIDDGPSIKKPRTAQANLMPFYIGGGVAAVALVIVVVMFATRGQDNGKQKENDGLVQGPGDKRPANTDESKKVEPPKKVIKVIPPKKGPPPKIDMAPPLVVAEEFKEVKVLRGHTMQPKAMTVSADGKRLLTVEDMGALIWLPNAEKPSRCAILSPPGIGAVFLPSGREIAVADGGSLMLIDLSNYSMLRKIFIKNGSFSGLVAGTDGKHVATIANDGTLGWWDLAKPREDPEKSIDVGGKLKCLALASDGKTAAVGSDDGMVSLWDVRSGAQIKSKWKAHTGDVNALAFSGDGKRLVTVGKDKLAHVWEVPSAKAVLSLKGHTDEVTSVVYTSDGGMIITGSDDMTVLSFDAVSGEPLRFSIKPEQKVTALALAPKDAFVIAGTFDGGVHLSPLPAVRPDSPPRVLWVQTPKQPLPPPLNAAVEAAGKTIRDKYKNDYARTAPEDILALYDKLMLRARVGQEDPAARYALFQEARDVAGKAGRMEDSFKALEERAKWFDADELADKTGALLAAAMGTVNKPVVEAAVAVIEEAEKLARPDIVDELFRQRKLFPQEADTPELNAKIVAADKRWSTAAMEREASQALAVELQKDLNDAKANLEYGKYLCFRIGEWEEGLPKIMKGNDMILKEIVKKEMADPKDGPGQEELAIAWRDYGDKAEDLNKPGLYLRAKYWLEKAVENKIQPKNVLTTKGLTTKLEMKIKEVGAATLARPGEPVARKSFNTARTAIAWETQWIAANAEAWTADGVTLKGDASLGSRFRLLDDCQIEFSFIPDGREIKISLNGETIDIKPAPTSNITMLSVTRKPTQLDLKLMGLTGTVLEEKTLMLPPAKQKPAPLNFMIPGPADKDGFILKTVVVNGQVKPMN